VAALLKGTELGAVNRKQEIANVIDAKVWIEDRGWVVPSEEWELSLGGSSGGGAGVADNAKWKDAGW
jgi:hypothetical protein